MPGRSGTIGEIQRPLIFRLKSRYQLHEIVAQKMHISDTVYPMFDVDRLLGNAVSTSGVTAAAAGTGFRAATVVPAGKRWRLQAVSGQVTTAGGSAMVWNLAVRHLMTSSAGGGSDGVAIGVSVAAGVLTMSAAQMFDSCILEPSDLIGIWITTADATERITVYATVFEEDWRENVV